MKNLAKKTIAIAAAGIMIFFSGCSNLLGGGDSSQNNEKKYTVSGSINLGSALPSSVASALQSAESSARTATSSFSSASASAVWTVTAKQGEKSVTGSVYQVAGVYKYNLELPLSGEWLLHVKMTIGSSVILEGGASLFAVSGTSQVQDVFVSPVTSSGTGSVNLTITDGTASTLISRVSSKAVQNLHAIDSHGGNSVNTGIKEFTNKKAAIVMNNVPAGRYEATLNFEDAAGNILYSCKEIFTVFAGFTTDTWSGESAYMHNGVFSVTDALINGYGTETVNATDTILYTPYSEGTASGYEFKIGDGSSLKSTTTDSYSFCFDENGDIFYVSNLGSYKTDISSKRENFGRSGSVSLGGDATNNRCFTTIQYDKITKKLYGVTTTSSWNSTNHNYDNSYSLFEYSVDEMTDSWEWSVFMPGVESNAEKLYVIDGLSSNSSLSGKFTIHNGTVYVPYYNNGYKLFKANLSDAVLDNAYYLHVANIGSIDLNVDSNISGSVTDCMYQDGWLTFLVSEKNVAADYIVTRGAVIRVNLFGYKADYIGWNTQTMDNSSVYLYAYASDTDALFVDNDYSARVVAKASEIKGKDSGTQLGNIYTSSGKLTKNVFFGPKKFIAIKPKKLVIADDGLFFYTDANGGLKYKNANRIVTVDLEDFAITDVEEASVAFGEDETGNLIGTGGCGYISACVYYSDADKTTVFSPYYTASGESKTTVYCCKIPCGDNE